MKNNEREMGFYRVKYNDVWSIALYTDIDGDWLRVCDEQEYSDSDFQEIGERITDLEPKLPLSELANDELACIAIAELLGKKYIYAKYDDGVVAIVVESTTGANLLLLISTEGKMKYEKLTDYDVFGIPNALQIASLISSKYKINS